MRILLITGEYPPLEGGVGDYTRELARAFVAEGAAVHVLTAAKVGKLTNSISEDAGLTIEAGWKRADWRLWRYALQATQRFRPDVVQIQYQSAAYDLHPAINFLPHRLHFAFPRLPVFTTFHDLLYPYLFPKAGPLRWRTVRALIQGSTGSVVTNTQDWQQLQRAGLLGKAHAIPIGSNIKCKPPAGYDRSEQRARWHSDSATWLLGYFGFLNASKGGETLVRALKSLVDAGQPARLLMVGGKVGSSDPTNLAYLARIETLIEELDLASRVEWTGFTENSEVSANLLATDCMVLPYLEGASLRHGSLMAALAHGRPIVTTKALDAPMDRPSPFPALQDHVNALLIPPLEPESVASAVVEAMTNATLRSELARGAAQLAGHFTWEEIARAHLKMYDAALA